MENDKVLFYIKLNVPYVVFLNWKVLWHI